MAEADRGAAPQRSDVAKAGIASLTASSIEWYDFFIYLTAAALVFPAVFFPESSEVAGVLAAFSTAAVGFVARPVGGMLFGHFGDRLGRKPTLVIALIIMGTATFLVGLLPGYATIGVLAPILLFVLRFCQGLAIGGQWGGAVLLATEYAPPNRRGLFGSFAQTGVPVGVITGNLVFLLMAALTTEAQFGAWGWRVPFLIGVLLVGVAMFIQLRLEDTPAFRHLEESQEEGDAPERSPVLEVITQHPKQILLAGGAFFVINGSFYILISGILDYGTRNLGLSSDAMLAAVLVSSAIQIPALIGFAALTDRVGRRPVYLAGAVLLGIWGFPMFLLIDTGSIVLITIALSIGQIFLSMMYGPQAALYAEMFSARVRYSGASLGYQGASVFAGGLAPIIMVSLLQWTGTSLSVSFYILAMAAITFVSVYLITETYDDEMAEDVAAGDAADRRVTTGQTRALEETPVYETILFEKRDGIADVALNRPTKLNAFDGTMHEELYAALDSAANDDEVRCVVLRGEGRGFSAGADLAGIREGSGEDPDLGEYLRNTYSRLVRRMVSMEKSIVASLHGPVYGAGVGISLACDLRVAAQSAKFSVAFIKIGLMPDAGVSFFLPRVVGLGRALEMSMLGDPVEAEEALRIGLVNRVVPDEALTEETAALAARLAAMPTAAIGRTKGALYASFESDLDAMLEREAEGQTFCGYSADHGEGVAAFFEKREAKFTGR